jgi:hypothetical protein
VYIVENGNKILTAISEARAYSSLTDSRIGSSDISRNLSLRDLAAFSFLSFHELAKKEMLKRHRMRQKPNQYLPCAFHLKGPNYTTSLSVLHAFGPIFFFFFFFFFFFVF